MKRSRTVDLHTYIRLRASIAGGQIGDLCQLRHPPVPCGFSATIGLTARFTVVYVLHIAVMVVVVVAVVVAVVVVVVVVVVAVVVVVE